MTTLQNNLQDLATLIATDMKVINTLINGNLPNNSSLTTTAKNNLVAAINEIKGQLDNLPTGSSVTSQINAAIAALVDLAPENLNTLKELADANSTVLSALSNRVRVDAVQSFSTPQKDQACSNIGAVKLSDTGDVTADLVAIYTTGRG